MKKIVIVLLALVPMGLFAQDYKVSLIPDSLKTDANAVGRYEEMRVVIKGIDKAVVKHKYAITILNEDGDRFAQYVNYYSNLVSLSDISGRLLDAEGKVLRTIRKKDIADLSGSDDETILTDTRTKSYAFYNKNYPYTVEFEDEQEYNGIFYLPSWAPVAGQKFSVQQSRFIVETPADYQLRYKQFNYDVSPVIANAKTISYTWEIKNRKAIKYEPLQPSPGDVLPDVHIAPSEFAIGNYKGNMSTWAGLGKFITELNKNRGELPEQTKSNIRKLTEGVPDISEKAKRVYKYLQQNTRYVSIQLGIGSWQPFDAKFVADKKYGDCKALSNYMVSMLKEAGVKAHYVLIKAGADERGLTEDFPAPNFSHVVCCVPTGKDTLWFECTSQTNAPGFMGSFTGDRQALLIDEDGGHVVRTPLYPSTDNNQFRRIKAVVDENGNMVADVYTRATGIQQEDMHGLIYSATKEQRDKYLNQVLSLPTYTVDQSDYKETAGSLPMIDEYLHVKAPGYASVSGKRLFIQPNLFNRSSARFTDEGDRKFPIHFSYAFRDIDTVQITIPAGYTPEAVPKNVSLQTPFGKFDVTYAIRENTIEVIRSQVRERAEFPASTYGELVKYFDAVYKADHSRIVFVKKEG